MGYEIEVPGYVKNTFKGAEFSSHETDLYILPATDRSTAIRQARHLWGNACQVHYSEVKGQPWYGKFFIEIPFFFLDQKIERSRREKRHHLTSQEHYEKYREMSEESGIKYTGGDRFLGYTTDQLRLKYQDDVLLNNIPLSTFDASFYRIKGGPKSLSDNTCLLKHIIKYQVLKLKPIFR